MSARVHRVRGSSRRFTMNVRGWLPLVVLLAALALLAGCGGADTEATDGAAAPEPTAPETTGETTGGAAAGAETQQACLVIGGDGVTDRGFNQSAWEGAQAGAKTVGWTARYVFAPQGSDAVPTIAEFTRESCGIIIPVSFLYTDQTEQAAERYRDEKFAIVDVSYQPPLDNVRGLVFDSAQSSFLAGYLAAGMTQTAVVGTYGGIKIPPVTLFMDGYAKGIEHYNSVHGTDVRLLGWNLEKQDGTFVGNFTDTAKGKQIAQALMQQRADVIFGLGGLPDFGAAQAIESQGAGKVSMIWPNTDGCVAVPKHCDIFLTSVLKGVHVVVEQAVKDAANGEFTGGTYLGTLENDGVGIAPYHEFEDDVPDALKEEIEEIREQIASGELEVSSASKPQ
jgi:basic membrane protein A